MGELIHEFSWTSEASRAETFAALTTESALSTWFAENVDIDRREGGNFRFWGRHTLDTATSERATQRIIGLKEDEELAFEWQLLGQHSVVTLQLHDHQGTGSKIDGSHVFEESPSGVRIPEMIDDLWRLSGGNLVAFLQGSDGICLPDFDDPNPEITQSILVDAPREKVFRALITPELLEKWMWGNEPVVDARQGGRYSYGWRYDIEGNPVEGGPTRILEYVENVKLVTDWPDWRGDKSVPLQTVTWLLEEVESKTRVTVIHSGFVRAVDFSDYPFGWKGFLSNLSDLVMETL